MNMFKKNGGFTLVELIVVIAILAILAGVAIPAYSGYINSANKAADITACDAIKTAAMAALATEGEVTQITITSSTVVVECKGENVTLAGDGAEDTDFDTYYTSALPTFKTLTADKKTATTASWDISSDAAAGTKGEWVFTAP